MCFLPRICGDELRQEFWLDPQYEPGRHFDLPRLLSVLGRFQSATAAFDRELKPRSSSRSNRISRSRCSQSSTALGNPQPRIPRGASLTTNGSSRSRVGSGTTAREGAADYRQVRTRSTWSDPPAIQGVRDPREMNSRQGRLWIG